MGNNWVFAVILAAALAGCLELEEEGLGGPSTPASGTGSSGASVAEAGGTTGGPPQILFLGKVATVTECRERQTGEVYGPVTEAGYFYWEHTYEQNATVVHANATIWMEVYEAFILPTSMGWSFQHNNVSSYRLGGDYWSSLTPLVEPGVYRIELDSTAYGDVGDRTFEQGQSMGIHWNPTNLAITLNEAYAVLCEPGRMSQMWVEYDQEAAPNKSLHPTAFGGG